MPKVLENMIPGGANKFEKKTKEVPSASKKGPGELPRPKMRPTKSRDGLQRSPGTPEAPQKPKKQFLAVRKPSLGALRGPPWRSTGGAQIVLFDMNGLHWPPK